MKPSDAPTPRHKADAETTRIPADPNSLVVSLTRSALAIRREARRSRLYPAPIDLLVHRAGEELVRSRYAVIDQVLGDSVVLDIHEADISTGRAKSIDRRRVIVASNEVRQVDHRDFGEVESA